MRAPARRLVVPLLALAWGVAGCPPVDNSGGKAPGGEAVDHQVVVESLGVVCADAEDTAVLLDGLADVDAFLADCVKGDATIREATAALDTIVGTSYSGEREFVLPLRVGGCLSVLHLFEVRLEEPSDGDPVLRPWVLRGDDSFEAESDCAAADGQQIVVGRAKDAGTAESIELLIGTYNPTLPGAPQPEIYE